MFSDMETQIAMEGGCVQKDIDGDTVEHQPALTIRGQFRRVVVGSDKVLRQRIENPLRLRRGSKDVEVDVDGRPWLTCTPQQGKGPPEGVGDSGFVQPIVQLDDGIEDRSHRPVVRAGPKAGYRSGPRWRRGRASTKENKASVFSATSDWSVVGIDLRVASASNPAARSSRSKVTTEGTEAPDS